ncbi:MMPL family transporter [Frankia sp. AgB1.9]|uniref:MMPL family transporter n=1 Tax=unclassified Frankia TaxID=2632575 RepID=UPI0019349CB8|nr:MULTISPECIES: MMPL family transporter [unclassified Frankia]MBL7489786.1 MMPL family transporter [Frankia sp. AgW1.1]MBL7552611.1 MMPL family transporter [Frankia sp. AgB1.9]MBL7623699.1 MMPL family transporter [Frankia sp. AgB1.8]
MLLIGPCVRHRWVVVGLWTVCLVTLVVLARGQGARFDTDVAVPGSDSARALDLAGRALGGTGIPDTEAVVVHARHSTVDDPLVRAQIAAMVTQLGTVANVAGVVDPFSAAGAVVLGVDPVSANRHTAVVSVIVKGSALHPDRATAHRLVTTARSYDGPTLQVEVAGPDAAAVNATALSWWPILIALAAALLLLGATLRSRGAVAVCAATTAVATVTAVAIAVLLSHATTMTLYAPLLAAVVAAGTSLGGTVVVVHRAQSRLREGAVAFEAVTHAAARTGFAIACGGLCVTLAMDGVVALGLPFFNGVALGSAAAGTATGVVILTLLPAVLAICGPRLLGWTERHHLITSGRGLSHPPGLRAAWASWVHRRPLVAACAAAFLLLALAAPALTLKLGGADDGAESTSSTTRRAYDLLSADFFPGLNGPMLVAVQLGATPSAVSPDAVVAALAKTPGVAHAAVSVNNTKADVAMIRVFPAAGPRSPDATAVLDRIRDQVIPRTLAGTGSQAYVGGSTALFVDMAADFHGATTGFLAVVMLTVLGCGLLILRSGTIAAALALTSALAILAAAGVLALLFQNSLVTRTLGLTTGPVEPSLLVIVLVAVFGLLPGLNLGLLVRLTEPTDTFPGGQSRHRDAAGPVRLGHADVGHVMLTMNLVMLFLFAAVAAQPARMMKVIGCGLAAGVAIDAFVLRATLLPAILHLIDRRQPAPSTHRGPGDRPARRPGMPDLGWPQSLVGGPPDPTITVGDGGVERATVPIRVLPAGKVAPDRPANDHQPERAARASPPKGRQVSTAPSATQPWKHLPPRRRLEDRRGSYRR